MIRFDKAWENTFSLRRNASMFFRFFFIIHFGVENVFFLCTFGRSKIEVSNEHPVVRICMNTYSKMSISLLLLHTLVIPTQNRGI